ncbi:MAG: aldehyde:ferredoxin oxidoreductase [Thermoproteota archaeon]|nr:MAG: aldehyde:ferredoxin oxidoreductase [Candidatus Korarchaeota archaeon]
MDYGGYAGRIARVDLTTGKVSVQETPRELARLYIGGSGMAARIMWEEVGPEVDPLGPDNLLIMATGPVTGTAWHTSGRGVLVSKSPLTGIWAESHFGGHAAPELKFAGFDALIIRGRAPKPSYLLVYDGGVEIKSAEHLWGKDTHETISEIREEAGDPWTQVLAIGQAGEHLVKYAAVMTNYHDAAGRTGMGAVMGSKRLKAIAIRGFNSVRVAKPDEFYEFCLEGRDRVVSHEQAMELRRYGTPMLVEVKQSIGELPTKNHWTGVFDAYERIGSHTLKERYWVATKACFACSLACKKRFYVRSGEFAGTYTGGPEYEGLYALGSNCLVDNLPAILRMNLMCNRYGLDVISLGAVFAFVMELVEKGILSREEAMGLTWGDYHAMMEAVEAVAFRRGFGDLMAEGVREMARRIGRGAERYAMHVKGLEISGQDGRTHRSAGLTHAISVRGADHLRSLVTVDQLAYRDVAAQRFGEDKADRVVDGYSEDYKGLVVKVHEEAYAVRDSLIVCWYSVGWPPIFWVEDFAKLLYLATGEEAFRDPREVWLIGERIVNLKRAFNVRLGLDRKDDTLPERFTKEPMPAGPGKGQVVDLERMLREYYELRGWDVETGLPTREKLEQLGLWDVADELERMGRLPRAKAAGEGG